MAVHRKRQKPKDKIVLIKAMPESENGPLSYWADFWELQCFFSKDKLYSMTDLVDYLEDSSIGQRASYYEDEKASFEENKENELISESQVERNLISVMSYRKYLFENHYPFRIDQKLRTISLKSHLRENHKLYISLLLSSNITLVRPNAYHDWTSKFEFFSLERLKLLLPEKAKVLNFGACNLNEEDKLPNLIKKRFEIIAKEVRIKTTPEFDSIPKIRRGDLGVDLVGYGEISSKDKCDRASVISFAQCTCSRNWIPKQKSVLLDVLRKFFQFRTAVMPVMFIPHCFRDSQGIWERPYEVEHIVIVDRFRFFSGRSRQQLEQLFKKYYSSLLGQLLKLDVET